MSKFFTNINSEINLYTKKSIRSPIVTQMIYGDTYSIIIKKSNWWKIKITKDGYVGFIKKIKSEKLLKTSHKVSVLAANFYKQPNKKIKLGTLTFGSKLKIDFRNRKFSRFQNMWIENKNLKPMQFKNKDVFLDIKIFNNIKYKWGGKTFKGLDCSALIQLFLNFNNRFCPRDAKDQIRYFKKNIKLKNINKNDIIYWKGHVAVALSKTKLIHAYGPLKKTVIMEINKTINLIKKTAKLNVLAIKRL